MCVFWLTKAIVLYVSYIRVGNKNQVDFEVDNDNDDNIDDDYSCNSINFQARISRFSVEVDLNNTYDMMMMMMVIDVTQSFFQRGPPDFERK